MTAIFHYKIGGDPYPTYQWFKGINPLEESENISYKHDEETDEYKMIIHSVTPDDGGNYTCVLTNEAGVEKQPVTLIVEEKAKLAIPGSGQLRR